jgi:hypothetical protein
MAPALASGDGGGNGGGEEAAARRLRLRAAAACHARLMEPGRRLQHDGTREHGMDTCQKRHDKRDGGVRKGMHGKSVQAWMHS